MDMPESVYLALAFQTVIPVFAGIGFLSFTRVLGPRESAGASAVFLFLQCLLLGGSATESLGALIFFIPLFIALGFFLRRATGSRFARYTASTLCAVFLAVWFYSKYAAALHLMDDVTASSHPTLFELKFLLSQISLVGISYIGFKLIHFLIDYRQKAITTYSVWEVVNWLFFFPSIIAGPMQRFQDWQKQRENARLTLEHSSVGIRRIVQGLFFKTVLADSIHASTIATMSLGTLATGSPSDIILAAMVYTIYLYFDFAGYSHIAIGVGHFWGITLPENFNAPYRARNLADFWKRWHITLSELLRDYLFYPLSLTLKRLDFFKRRILLATIIPPIATFTFAGIWHGASYGFLIFGLLHGCGLAWLAALGRRKRRQSALHRWWRESRLAHLIASVITFLYVSFSFVFFCLSNQKLEILWNRFFS